MTMNAFAFGNNDKFVENYTNAVDSFATLSTHPTIYVALPAWVAMDDPQVQYTEARLVSVIIPEIRSVAMNTGARLIDFHAVTEGHPEHYKDSLHPNDAGSAIMAKLAYDTITSE
jgi:lysophospholipase L1-like esterase